MEHASAAGWANQAESVQFYADLGAVAYATVTAGCGVGSAERSTTFGKVCAVVKVCQKGFSSLLSRVDTEH